MLSYGYSQTSWVVITVTCSWSIFFQPSLARRLIHWSNIGVFVEPKMQDTKIITATVHATVEMGGEDSQFIEFQKGIKRLG